MWTCERTLNDLTGRSAWMVEFFCGPAGATTGGAPAHAAVPLRQLARERRESIDPQTAPDRQFNYLSLENVEPLTGDLIGFAPKFGREIRSRSKVFRPGDVLYGRLRPNLNKVFVADGQLRSGICSGEFYVLVPDAGRILSAFLRTVLASDLIHPHLANRQSGSALPRLGLDDLLDTGIPLPPLKVQQKLAAAVAKDAIRRRKLLKEAKALPQSWMKRFTGNL